MKKCDLLKKLYLKAPESFNENDQFADEKICAHISACPDCQAFLKRVRSFDGVLKTAVKQEALHDINVRVKVKKILSDYNGAPERKISFSDEIVLYFKRLFAGRYSVAAASAGICAILLIVMYSFFSLKTNVFNDEIIVAERGVQRDSMPVSDALAVLKNIKGKVEVIRDGVKRTFDHGSENSAININVSDKITVTQGSNCDLIYENGVCSLTSAGVEVLDKKIIITAGKVLFDFEHGSFSKKSPYVIETLHGYVHIIGTKLEVEAAPEGDRVKLIDGVIEIGKKTDGDIQYHKCVRGDEILISPAGIKINDKLIGSYASARYENNSKNDEKVINNSGLKRVVEESPVHNDTKNIASEISGDKTVSNSRNENQETTAVTFKIDETQKAESPVKIEKIDETAEDVISNNDFVNSGMNGGVKSDFPIESEWIRKIMTGDEETASLYRKMSRKELHERYLKEKSEYNKNIKK